MTSVTPELPMWRSRLPRWLPTTKHVLWKSRHEEHGEVRLRKAQARRKLLTIHFRKPHVRQQQVNWGHHDHP